MRDSAVETFAEETPVLWCLYHFCTDEKIFTVATLKHTMNVYTHLLQPRRKTSA